MKLRYKITILLGFIVCIVGWLHFKRPVPVIALPVGRTSEDALKLPDYGHGNIIITKRVGNRTVTTISPKVTGFPLDFGVSGAIGGNKTELYLTTELFYYRHMEVLIGGGLTYPVIRPRVMLGLGYRLPWKRVDNLSTFVAYNMQYPIVGLYARFGSN